MIFPMTSLILSSRLRFGIIILSTEVVRPEFLLYLTYLMYATCSTHFIPHYLKVLNLEWIRSASFDLTRKPTAEQTNIKFCFLSNPAVLYCFVRQSVSRLCLICYIFTLLSSRDGGSTHCSIRASTEQHRKYSKPWHQFGNGPENSRGPLSPGAALRVQFLLTREGGPQTVGGALSSYTEHELTSLQVLLLAVAHDWCAL
jgi:hypothetical protein